MTETFDTMSLQARRVWQSHYEKRNALPLWWITMTVRIAGLLYKANIYD